jgi:hypothetical protein
MTHAYYKLSNTMVNSFSFVSTGTFNHVFPSLPMHTLLSSKFPPGNLVENKGFLCLLIFPCMLDEGNLEESKGFLCLLIFPCMLDEGNLEDKSVPHYL